MSSFKDNFTRGSGDQNLQYDDTAFYYFAISMLSSLSLIILFFIVKRLLSSTKELKKRINECDLTLSTKLKNKEASISTSKYNWTFKILVIAFFLCIYFAYSSAQNITKKDDMKRFDPYEILSITRGATIPEIRKAYKKMVLIYHPDKDPSPEAAAKFLLITKANECLTDETKRVVCEQFGSPDGPGSLHVAIAMPSFFQKKENHVFILACFSLFFIIFLPAAVLSWLNRSQTHNSHGMSVENYKLSFQQLSQNMAPTKLLEILGFCDEFKFPISKSEQDYFRKQTQFLDESYPSTKGIPATKGQKLLILRFESIPIPKESQQHMDEILKTTPKIIDSIIDQCLQINNIFPKTDKRYLSIQSLHNVIFFQQHFYEGVWSTKQETDFDQISLVHSDVIPAKKLQMRYKTLRQLIATPIEARKYDLPSNLTDQQKDEIIKKANDEVDSFPVISVKVDVLFDEEGEHKQTATQSNRSVSFTAEAGQIVSFNVSITYLNYPEKGEGRFALLHRYPYFKDMSMHVYMTEIDSDKIIEYSLLTGQQREIEFKTKKMLPVGDFNFEIFVKTDCYVGFDESFRITAKITKPTPKSGQDSEVHPLDLEKASEPNFIEKLLMPEQQQQDDEEDEEEVQQNDEKKEEEEQQDGQDDEEEEEGDDQKKQN